MQHTLIIRNIGKEPDKFQVIRLIDGKSAPTPAEIPSPENSPVEGRPDSNLSAELRQFDIIAESICGRVVVAEVKKTKDATGPKIVEDFHEKVKTYAKHYPDKTILPTVLSLGGFTEDAAACWKEQGIATAEKTEHF